MRKIGAWLILLAIVGTSCRTDKTKCSDITLDPWKLRYIEVADEIIPIPEGEMFRKEPYTLVFDTDTSFSCHTNVNIAGGNYVIPGTGILLITSYGEQTEVASSAPFAEFNAILVQRMNEAQSYQVIENILEISFGEGMLVFERI